VHPSPENSLASVRQRIERATTDAGRPPASVGLVAVTKEVEPEQALALARLGQRDLGENRVGELERKARAFRAAAEEVHWHFIGHLQRNKARRVLAWAQTIHSVDSERLLDTLERLAQELGKGPGLYLQVHLSGEQAKHGLARGEVAQVLRTRKALGSVELLGLMAMAPLADTDGSGARRVFADLAALAVELESDATTASHFRDRRVRLSMGMSRDLETAVAAGADWVRVGRALFPASTPTENNGSPGSAQR
jgi:pyridoxal phosphate enzyme (YggS family)